MKCSGVFSLGIECDNNVPILVFGKCPDCLSKMNSVGTKIEKSPEPSRFKKCEKCSHKTSQGICSKCRKKEKREAVRVANIAIEKTVKCKEIIPKEKPVKAFRAKRKTWKVSPAVACPNPLNNPNCEEYATGFNKHGLCCSCNIKRLTRFKNDGTPRPKKKYKKCEICGIPTNGTRCKKHRLSALIGGKCPNPHNIKGCLGTYRASSTTGLCVKCRRVKRVEKQTSKT